MPGQYEVLPCPFCEKGQIQCLYFPGATKVRSRSSATFGKIKERVKSSDAWIIQSGCNVCGKNQEEVEKELRRKEVI